MAPFNCSSPTRPAQLQCPQRHESCFARIGLDAHRKRPGTYSRSLPIHRYSGKRFESILSDSLSLKAFPARAETAVLFVARVVSRHIKRRIFLKSNRQQLPQQSPAARRLVPGPGARTVANVRKTGRLVRPRGEQPEFSR